VGSYFRHTRRAPEVLRQLTYSTTEPEVQLLAPAGRTDRPGLVAEVALELPFDRRGREGRELEIAARIEAFDCFQQSDERNLFQIVELLTTIREPARQVCRKTLMGLDQFVPKAARAGLPVLDKLRSLYIPRFGVHARAAYPGRSVHVKQTRSSAISTV